MINSLGAGGAERVASVLANGLSRRGHSVLVLTNHPRETDFYELDAEVERVSIGPFSARGLAGRIRDNLRRLRGLRDTITRWDAEVVIPFMGITNVRVILALTGSRIPVVATEHSNPKRAPLPIGFAIARRIVYRSCAGLVSVSRGLDGEFHWIPRQMRRVINNPLPFSLAVDPLPSQPLPSLIPDQQVVVGMGRLVPQKGFDVLLDAFALVAREFPDWHLLILGEGPERESLLRQAHRLELTERTTFPGTRSDPFSTLRRCQLFVLSSRHEGFGNVVVEAMACGLPVVAADCPSGPNEIVTHGVDGLLVPVEDTPSLAAAMRRLMSDSTLREQYGRAAVAKASNYRPDTILDQWEQLLASLRTGSSISGGS